MGGIPWEENVPQEDLEILHRTYSMLLKKKEPFQVGHKVKRYDGEERWVLATGKARVKEGKYFGFIGSSFDITDRKIVEKINAQHPFLLIIFCVLKNLLSF